jgi:hypothetical protein
MYNSELVSIRLLTIEEFQLGYVWYWSVHKKLCKLDFGSFRTTLYTIQKPNVVVQGLAILLRVREIPGSNLGSETE